MNTESLVSIIVAVFNGKETLQRCIDSIVSTSYSYKELIIIDGGSTDGTLDILKANTDKIAYWESGPDRGIYHAWNKGLDHARGEWICFLGADDFFADSSSLEKLVSVGMDNDVDLISGHIAIVDQFGKIVRIMGEPWNWEQMKHFQNIAHPGMLHRKRLFDRYGQFNDKYKIAGDYEFLLRLGNKTRACFVNDVVLYAGNAGLSRTNIDLVFNETRLIQSLHNEIGPTKAKYNYWLAILKLKIKKALCVS